MSLPLQPPRPPSYQGPNTSGFLFVLGGARSGGVTEELARCAANRLPADVGQHWIRLADLPLPGFEDTRGPRPGPRPAATAGENERLLLEATLAATDLVIASPLYWYSVSAATKLYLDYWSAWMQRPELEFRQRMSEKTLWSVSSLSSPDPADADPLVGMLRRTAGYLGMHWGGALLGRGAGSGLSGPHPAALARAERSFGPIRVAVAA
jgi:hypothetical protein